MHYGRPTFVYMIMYNYMCTVNMYVIFDPRSYSGGCDITFIWLVYKRKRLARSMAMARHSMQVHALEGE